MAQDSSGIVRSTSFRHRTPLPLQTSHHPFSFVTYRRSPATSPHSLNAGDTVENVVGHYPKHSDDFATPGDLSWQLCFLVAVCIRLSCQTLMASVNAAKAPDMVANLYFLDVSLVQSLQPLDKRLYAKRIGLQGDAHENTRHPHLLQTIM